MTDPTRSGPTTIACLAMAVTIAILSACAQRPTPTSDSGRELAVATSEPPLVASMVQPVQLRQGHPQRYVVQPGDTLWGIAARFLNSPWRWPEIWQSNPAIGNPNRIYPGDILELYYEGATPRLRLTRAANPTTTGTVSRSGERPIIKLSPQIRVEPLEQPIPTVPRDAIRSFINKSRVVSDTVWEAQPYIIAGETDRINLLNGDRIYVRGAGYLDQPVYQVFRPGEAFQNPVTGEFLGYQLQYLGDAALEDPHSDPAVLRLLASNEGVRIGDRLFEPNNDDVTFQFLPRPAPADVKGHIVAALDGGFLVGRDDSVVVSLGDADGLEAGHVLVANVEGSVVNDPVTGEPVLLPSERAGVLMVYQTFDRVSYALVMDAGRTIRINDEVGSPL